MVEALVTTFTIGLVLGLTAYAFYDIMVDREWRAR